MYRYVFILTLAGAFALVGCSERDINIDALPYDLQQQYEQAGMMKKEGFEMAVEAFNVRNYERAIEILRSLNVTGQDKAYVLNLQGAAYTKLKNFDRARESFENALGHASDFFPPRFNLAEIEFLQGRYTEALEKFTQLAQSAGVSDLLVFKIYLSNLKLGDTITARRLLDRMPRLGSTPIWYYASAAWEFNNGNMRAGRNYVRIARELYPAERDRQLYEETLRDLGWL